MPNTDALELLYQALASPIGIVVRVTDIERARARLYKAKADARDPALANLQLRKSPLGEPDVIWIVKGGEVDMAKLKDAETSKIGDE